MPIQYITSCQYYCIDETMIVMTERLGEMKRGRRERIEKGSRQGIEKETKRQFEKEGLRDPPFITHARKRAG